MKKITIAVLLISALTSQAQVTKTTIAEHFTNTSCGVCAATNPTIQGALTNNPTVLSIRFHPSAPYANDFFNQQNMTENDARTNYYGIYGGTPRVLVNGTNVSPNSLNTTLASLQTETSNFSIVALQQQQSPSDSLRIKVIIKKVAADTTLMANLFVGIIEDTINQTTNNGETVHYNVFRKSISSTVGDAVTLPTNIGDSIVLNYIYKANSAWPINRLNTLTILEQANKKVINSTKAIKSIYTPLAISNITTTKNDVSYNMVLNKLVFKKPIAELKILSISGSKMYEAKGLSSQLNFELPKLLPGLYFVIYNTANQYQTTQFLIQ